MGALERFMWVLVSSIETGAEIGLRNDTLAMSYDMIWNDGSGATMALHGIAGDDVSGSLARHR